MKTEAVEIWQEYQKGIQYLQTRHLFETVKTNERYYDGDQWGDLKADGMAQPVFNFVQRNTKYQVATITSNDIGISILPFTASDDDIAKIKPIATEVEKVFEREKIKGKSKLAVRYGAVDGSCYMMQMFDPDYETGQEMKGKVVNKLIYNTNMIYGNPYSSETQEQPFIIVAFRQHLSQVKAEAEDLGLSQEDIDDIKPDNDMMQENDDSDELVTVLIKFYKKKTTYKEVKVVNDLDGNEVEVEEERTEKTVWFTKTTQTVTLIEPTDLGYKRYPISCFGWEPVMNSYVYNSPITSIIENQVFINKCFGMAQMYVLQNAIPDVVYDDSKARIEDILGNSPMAVANMEMMGKFLDFIKAPDFSNNLVDMLTLTIDQTKETMGVTDAALGNVNPDNTSAIIALQESSNVPLEIQRQAFYDFIEDTVRNILDIMANTYGVRQVITENEKGEKTLATIDFGLLKNINYEVNVDIGNASQFSEVAQMNTLNALYDRGVISKKLFIDSIPAKYIPNKSKIEQYVEQLEKQEQEAMKQQMMMQNQPIVEGGIVNAQ